MTDPSSNPTASGPEHDDEISLVDLLLSFLEVLSENARLIFGGTFLASLGALAVALLMTPIFTAKVSFLPPTQGKSAASGALQALGNLGLGADIKSPLEQYATLLQSVSVRDAIIERFNLMLVYEAEWREDARRELQGSVKISPNKKSELIEVSVDDPDPERAAAIANAYPLELQKILIRLSLTEAKNRREFFEKQLKQIRNDMLDAEKALEGSGVSAAALKANPQSAIIEVARLKAQITALEVQSSAMRSYMTENAPELKRVENELSALRRQLNATSPSEKVSSGEEESEGYLAKYRQFKYQETLFELMGRQYEIAKVDEAREGTVQVIDSAQVPERKSKPRRSLIILLITFVSFFALVGFAFVRRAWRQMLVEREDVRARIAGFRIFGRRRS